VRNKIPAEFEDGGVRSLKNIDTPVRVYKLVPSALVTAARHPSEPAEPPPAAYLPKTAREERRSERRGERERLREAALSRARSRSRELRAPRRRSLIEALTLPSVLVPFAIGVGLLSSPQLGIESGGLLPTAGAILVGLNFGRAIDLRRGTRGATLRFLGLGIMAGAHFTHWSQVTDFVFLLGGGVVFASGIARRYRAEPPEPPLPPAPPVPPLPPGESDR